MAASQYIFVSSPLLQHITGSPWRNSPLSESASLHTKIKPTMSAFTISPNENRGPAINAVAWTCVSISVLFVVSRLLTRVYITHNPGLGDILVVLSVILLIISAALTTVAINHGLGRHIIYLDVHQILYILRLNAILQPIGIFSCVVPKFAVALLITTMVGLRKQGVWFLYFLLFVLFVASALSVIFIFAQCNPPSHFWNPLTPAVCWSPNILKYTTIFGSSWSAFVNLCLSVFPITAFWNLQMKLGRKIGISILMGLGIFAMICAIIKTIRLSSGKNSDFTWEFFDLEIWTFIECAVVIVCACIPALPQLVLLLLGKREKPASQPSAQPTNPTSPSNE